MIDKKVAEYWREHYDLGHILRARLGQGLGKKLEGKINIYVGDMDNYYLNNAVYLVEDFLKTSQATRPTAAKWTTAIARALLERRARHAQRDFPSALPRDLRAQDRGADREERAAGGDVTSWRY